MGSNGALRPRGRAGRPRAGQDKEPASGTTSLPTGGREGRTSTPSLKPRQDSEKE